MGFWRALVGWDKEDMDLVALRGRQPRGADDDDFRRKSRRRKSFFMQRMNKSDLLSCICVWEVLISSCA